MQVAPFVPSRESVTRLDAVGPGPAAPAPVRAAPSPARPELGVLAPYATDGVTDLLLDGSGDLWADAGEGVRRVPDWSSLEPGEARALAAGLIATGGRHLDDASPCVDVRLPGGVRVHAVLPPVTTGGAVVSVRLGRVRPWRLDDLQDEGLADDATTGRLRDAVAERRNLLVCGPTGSGKTSLLAALLAAAPPTERIVTIEDVAELVIDHPHVIALEARQPNADGFGGVGLPRLVREALRMRPDRLVLGECRGAEVADLLTALNTGHDGGAGTLHSTSLDDVPARLEALGALAGLSPDALHRQVLSAIDLVVHLARADGRRRVAALGVPATDAQGRLVVVALEP